MKAQEDLEPSGAACEKELGHWGQSRVIQADLCIHVQVIAGLLGSPPAQLDITQLLLAESPKDMTHLSRYLFTSVETEQWARQQTAESQHAHTLLCAQTACSVPQWHRFTTCIIFLKHWCTSKSHLSQKQ